MISRWTRLRVAGVGLLLAVGGLAVVRRSIELLVHPVEIPGIGKRHLRDLAKDQAITKIDLPAQRGRILDRAGIELATTAKYDSVFCNPRQLAHVPDGSRRIASALGVPEREIREALKGRERKADLLLRRWVTAEQAAAVKALGIPGVYTQKEPKRIYLHGDLAGTVIGHTNTDGRGIEGVELAFDAALRGQAASQPAIRDASGRKYLIEGAADAALTAGADLVLTLDAQLTYKTQQALAEAVKTWNAKGAVAVVMDPSTGDILAMASVPTYDPNKPADSIERGARNRAITDWYEPGSTMKTFTFAAALELGKFDPWKSWWDCQGGRRLYIGRKAIKDDHPKGVITGAEVFQFSSNIGTIKIGRQYLGKEKLYASFLDFGFGRRTQVGLRGENPGLVHNARKWGEIHFATNAFGQGLTVTPLQMVAGYAAIASGGIYRPPRLFRKLVHPDGRVEEIARPEGARGEERILSPKTADTMLKLMHLVTQKPGTATRAAIPGYKVGGKTGTAQKAGKGGYQPGAYMASFYGVVPIDKPKFVIGVVVDEPQPDHYGGLVAAPAFRQIAEEALSHYGVLPTEPVVAEAEGDGKNAPLGGPEPPQKIRMDALEGLGYEAPVWEVVAGGDEEEGDAGEGGDEALVAEVVVPETIDVPSFSGMSLRQAIRAAAKLGLELEVDGSGVAVAQEPAPGPVVRGATCKVSFRPPGG